MISVAVLYIGQPRFENIGRENHLKLINKLKKQFNVIEYNYTQPILDRATCPFPHNDTGAARIQIWDFYQSLKTINERYIIKIRTDVWLTDSGINVVLSELSEIIKGSQRISYIGMETKNYFKEHNFKLSVGKGKVMDYIVIVDRNFIKPETVVMSELQQGKLSKLRSGNSTWKVIRPGNEIASTVCCQVYLIRKQYESDPSNWQVAFDFVSSYIEVDDALAWLQSTKDIGIQ